jgi:hypothetical protein
MRARNPNTKRFELFKVAMDMGRYVQQPQFVKEEDPEQGIMFVPSNPRGPPPFPRQPSSE